MNMGRFATATVAIFIFVFLFDTLVHGILLIDAYYETPNLWRNEENMLLRMCYQFALAAWIVFIYNQFYRAGMANALMFGLCLGAFAGILTSTWYVWLPVSAKLAFGWFVSSVIEGLGAGLILGYIYRNTKIRELVS
ncbi:MAG: hypothetical protein Q8K75_03750 [Chlamydiales bacterium]|nr:hypothetical protein [Chlamydiales bacterium]